MPGVNNSKKVCIVVPVYNAEKYLGYCLNSILSQSYTNWTAILVDDGSKDSSLEICNRYAKLDSRFQVISQPNGGVSKARNKGLEFADGDYLAFVDSDDCLSTDALEKQVALALKHNTQLVVVSTTILDFNNPEGEKVTLCSNWLGESPCYLTAEAFLEKRMRLIWYTALLEGPCGKLYDLKLWKELGLQFPEDLSLGEDFVTNMKYYNKCNSAVFLNESHYFYNQYMGSGSLTEKYRENLFEVKMYLAEQMEDHLGGREKLSQPELDAFYCYVASCGLVCVEKAILLSGLTGDALEALVKKMVDYPLFAESMARASYIPERFVECVKAFKRDNIGFAISYIADDVYAKTHGKKTGEDENKPGFVNRAVRKVMRMSLRFLGKGAMAERVGRWEREFAVTGIHGTVKLYRRLHKKVNVARLEDQTRYLEAQTKHLDEKLTHISASQATNIQQMEERLREHQKWAAQQIQENVNNYTWISEERMRKEAYLREINDLRQRKKAVMLGTAEHSNIGDAAITLAEQMFLQKYFPEYYQVEISTYEVKQKEAFLHAILNDDDILFIHGGGNIGDLYLVEEELHRMVVETFPNHKIIIFPQTIHFSNTETGRQELAKSAKVYNRHQDLTLYVRGLESLKVAQEHFTNVKTVLMCDMVHMLQTNYHFDREGVLLCLRGDSEGILTKEMKEKLKADLIALVGNITFRTNMHEVDVGRDTRGLVVRSELMRYARHRVVVTDRLHGMIFSAITGTPCVSLTTFNQKVREYYNTFFHDSTGIFFVDGQTDKVLEAVKEAMAVGASTNSVLEKDPYRQILANAQDK